MTSIHHSNSKYLIIIGHIAMHLVIIIVQPVKLFNFYPYDSLSFRSGYELPSAQHYNYVLIKPLLRACRL